jgi:hypothetical protein
MKAIYFFEASGSTERTTQDRNPEDLNPQVNRCRRFKASYCLYPHGEIVIILLKNILPFERP